MLQFDFVSFESWLIRVTLLCVVDFRLFSVGENESFVFRLTEGFCGPIKKEEITRIVIKQLPYPRTPYRHKLSLYISVFPLSPLSPFLIGRTFALRM